MTAASTTTRCPHCGQPTLSLWPRDGLDHGDTMSCFTCSAIWYGYIDHHGVFRASPPVAPKAPTHGGQFGRRPRRGAAP